MTIPNRDLHDNPDEEDHGLAEFNLLNSKIKTLNIQVRDLKRRCQEAEARAATLANELHIATAEVAMYKSRSQLDIEERDFYARYSTALLSKLASLGENASAMAKRTLLEATSIAENITELMESAKKEARVGSITSGTTPSSQKELSIPFAKPSSQSTPITDRKGASPPNTNGTK
jgi:hypothetical protein